MDDYIVDEVREFDDLNYEEIKKFIVNNRHNHTVTTYYLLLKKNLRLGINSPSDICSNIFNEELLASKNEATAETLEKEKT